MSVVSPVYSQTEASFVALKADAMDGDCEQAELFSSDTDDGTTKLTDAMTTSELFCSEETSAVFRPFMLAEVSTTAWSASVPLWPASSFLPFSAAAGNKHPMLGSGATVFGAGSSKVLARDLRGLLCRFRLADAAVGLSLRPGDLEGLPTGSVAFFFAALFLRAPAFSPTVFADVFTALSSTVLSSFLVFVGFSAPRSRSSFSLTAFGGFRAVARPPPRFFVMLFSVDVVGKGSDKGDGVTPDFRGDVRDAATFSDLFPAARALVGFFSPVSSLFLPFLPVFVAPSPQLPPGS